MVYESLYTMPHKYGKRTREFLGAFLFPFQSSFPRFWWVFVKTIIPLALVGYEMIIANSARCLSIISYPTRARGIIVNYHRFHWCATLENKTPAETFPKFPSVLPVIDRSDRNPPITATSVTFWPSLRHPSGLWLVDFDPMCRYRVTRSEILETFPRVFCFPKSRINENGGKPIKLITLQNHKVYQKFSVRSPEKSTHRNNLVRA